MAFLIAPMAGLLIAAAAVLPWIGEISLLPFYLFFGAFYVYPTALLVGLPLYFAMKRWIRHPRLWHYAAGGIVSSLPMVYLVLGVEGADHSQRWLTNSILCLLTGLNAGIVFGILISHFERRRESWSGPGRAVPAVDVPGTVPAEPASYGMSCCRNPAWVAERDLGSARGFDLMLGKCGTCGTPWINAFCVASSIGGYEPVTPTEVEAMRRIEDPAELKQFMRRWAEYLA